MVNFVRPVLFGAAAACVLSIQAANAAEHTILVMQDAYFPDITHVDPGDVVHFVNTTATVQEIVAEGEDWEVGPIPSNGQMSMVIQEAIQTKYFNAGSAGEDGGYTVSGHLSFEDAPVD